MESYLIENCCCRKPGGIKGYTVIFYLKKFKNLFLIVLGNRTKKKKRKKTDTDSAGPTKELSAVTSELQVTAQALAPAHSEEESPAEVWQSADAREIRQLQDLLDKRRQDLLQQQQTLGNPAAQSGHNTCAEVKRPDNAGGLLMILSAERRKRKNYVYLMFFLLHRLIWAMEW